MSSRGVGDVQYLWVRSWRDYIFHLALQELGVSLEEMGNDMNPLLKLLTSSAETRGK